MSNSDVLTARFLQEIEENSGLIYKVCYMYAEDSEHLKDLYQKLDGLCVCDSGQRNRAAEFAFRLAGFSIQ